MDLIELSGGDFKVFLGDCLDVMTSLEHRTIDYVFADLPYGKTSNKWDIPIDLTRLWANLHTICRDKTPITFTAGCGFEFLLYSSNPNYYRYKWVWIKNNSAGFATVKYRPFQICEDVLVFSKQSPHNYYPTMEERGKARIKGGYTASNNYSGLMPTKSKNSLYYPKNVLEFSSASQKGKTHPTQKPLDLLLYLIQTYTKPGDVVLDPVMGSGTTGVACARLGRKFIGIEKEGSYYYQSVVRISEELEMCKPSSEEDD